MMQNRSAPDGEGTSSKPLRFLDLPAELRTVVYEEIASETYLSNFETINTDPLLQVCKLIRKEYKPIFLSFVNIELSVNDWRFTPITSSISKLKTKKDAMATLEVAENITIFIPAIIWNDEQER